MTSDWLLSRLVELTATYLVQSTLFLAVAWALLTVLALIGRGKKSKPDGRECPSCGVSPALTERVWKRTAVLALVTSPLSVFTGWSRPVWEWSLQESFSVNQSVVSETIPPERTVSNSPPDVTALQTRSAPPPQAVATIAATALPREPREAAVAVFPESPPLDSAPVDAVLSQRAINLVEQPSHESVIAAADAARPSGSPLEPREETGPFRPERQRLGLALLAWFVLTGLRLVLKQLGLRRLLSGCEPITSEWRRELERFLPPGRSVRLWRAGRKPPHRANASGAVHEPFACGVWRWTIVLPAGIEQRLSAGEMQALLAHEAAHLVRRDPLWLWLGEVLCTCFAFQPLNLVARRAWQQAAELLCDDWAVERHVPATALANCLAHLAEAQLDRRAALMGLTAVGRSGSLAQRIEWLLRPGRRSESKRPRGRTLATLLTFSAGLSVGMYGPRLSLVTTLEAAPDNEVAAVWRDIHHDLSETLAELAQIESRLMNDSDPAAASLAADLHQRAALLREQLSPSQPDPARSVRANQSSSKGI